MKRFAFLLFVATAAHAQVVARSGNDILAAHDGVVERYDSAMKRVWSAPDTIEAFDPHALDDGVAEPLAVAVLAQFQLEAEHPLEQAHRASIVCRLAPYLGFGLRWQLLL